jgi:hypothetical protein
MVSRLVLGKLPNTYLISRALRGELSSYIIIEA